MESKKTMSEAQALSRLTGLCAKAEYCLSDIRKKMSAWELPEGSESRILSYLLKERYVDENRYAHAFVRSKFRFNRWGRDKIMRMMLQKGISQENIDDALNELKEDELDDTLLELLQAKNRHLSYKNDYDRYVKLLRFAVSRGFSMDSARRCIEKMDFSDE